VRGHERGYLDLAPKDEELSPTQGAVLSEIKEMLLRLSPAAIDPAEVAAKLDKKELQLRIPNRYRPHESVLITVAEDNVAVSFGYDHMHFGWDESHWLEDALRFRDSSGSCG
jgi:hypothetical protein